MSDNTEEDYENFIEGKYAEKMNNDEPQELLLMASLGHLFLKKFDTELKKYLPLSRGFGKVVYEKTAAIAKKGDEAKVQALLEARSKQGKGNESDGQQFKKITLIQQIINATPESERESLTISIRLLDHLQGK